MTDHENSRAGYLLKEARSCVKGALGHLSPLHCTIAGLIAGGPAQGKRTETIHGLLLRAEIALDALPHWIPRD